MIREQCWHGGTHGSDNGRPVGRRWTPLDCFCHIKCSTRSERDKNSYFLGTYVWTIIIRTVLTPWPRRCTMNKGTVNYISRPLLGWTFRACAAWAAKHGSHWLHDLSILNLHRWFLCYCDGTKIKWTSTDVRYYLVRKAFEWKRKMVNKLFWKRTVLNFNYIRL